MPFPFLLWGGAILGGLLLTGAILSKNEEERESARDRAREEASKEQEKIILEEQKRIKEEYEDLKYEYDEDEEVPKEEKERISLKLSNIYGRLEGNEEGLRAKGIKVSSEALKAKQEIAEMRKSMGLKE